MTKTFVFFSPTSDPFSQAHREITEAVSLYGDWVELSTPFDHPWKPDITPFAHRMAMLELGVADMTAFTINRELPTLLPKNSLTYQEIAYLLTKYPDARIRYPMGSDVAPRFHEYDEAAWMMAHIELLLIQRDDDDVERTIAASPFLSQYRDRIHVLPPLKHSHVASTDVRKARREGRPWEHMVPSLVGPYIKEHGLYLPKSN